MRISDWSSDVCSSDLHDGTDFDATDVVYSFKRLPTVPNGDGLTAAKLKSIDSIEIVNPHVVRIHTKTPDSGVLRALGQFFILPSELGEVGRSEEHTSELQSLMRTSYAVFCLKQKHTAPIA